MRRRKVNNDQFYRDVYADYMANEMTVAEIAKKYDIGIQTVYNTKKYIESGKVSFDPKKHGKSSTAQPIINKQQKQIKEPIKSIPPPPLQYQPYNFPQYGGIYNQIPPNIPFDYNQLAFQYYNQMQQMQQLPQYPIQAPQLVVQQSIEEEQNKNYVDIGYKPSPAKVIKKNKKQDDALYKNINYSSEFNEIIEEPTDIKPVKINTPTSKKPNKKTKKDSGYDGIDFLNQLNAMREEQRKQI